MMLQQYCTAFFLHTSSNAEDLDCCLLYALKWVNSPELIPNPEQQSAIESVYRGKDIFVWYLQEIIDLLPHASCRSL